MAKKPSKPQEVENYNHDAAKRTMIPTAEQQGFVEEDEARPIKLRYPRNLDFDPQFVWRGKDAEDATDLYVDAPPVYIQEKIHPRAIIERLKRDTSRRREAEADIPDLFADFNGRPKELEARTEFYQHEQNWQNRMILGDALMVMASLAERENLRGKVQCIYMDPPYGIKFNSNWQFSTSSRDVNDGTSAHISREPEVIRAFRDTWKDGVNTYLSYLRDRLVVSKDLLTETGSIFVQIGDENVHRVRALLDEVFGPDSFVSLISVTKTTSATNDFIAGVADYVIWYSKEPNRLKYRALLREKTPGGDGGAHYRSIMFSDGTTRPASAEERVGNLTDDSALFTADQLQSTGSHGSLKQEGAASWFPVIETGKIFRPTRQSIWKTSEIGMRRLQRAGRVIGQKTAIRYVRKFDDFKSFALNNVWTDIGAASDKSYVVETAPRLVERCILMTTDPGDLVLDPTCGSGTTAYAAEQWGRRWITIDTSRVALTLARARIMGTRYPYYLLRDTEIGLEKEAEIIGLAAHADRLAEVRREKHKPDITLGFVYRRVPHIQLRDIAGNTQIDTLWEEMHPAVESALTALNDSLKSMPEPFPVSNGARRGDVIDFMAQGEVTMPSGEPAPKNGFMEWEVPRDPGTPWLEAHQKLYALAKSWASDAIPAKRRKAEDALADLNVARKKNWTFETLPEQPVTQWPEAAEEALETFWEARIVRQSAIDAAIEREGNRNAEFLYDKPCDDPKTIRVAGPFTVESLSPYRVIPSDDDPRILDSLRDEEGELPLRVVPKEQTDFAQVVMEHLKVAGVQNTKKGERLEFDSIEPWPGKGYVAFEGRYEERGATRRAAIAIGPEYDAVGYEFVRSAAREARDAFDILIICGFQFAPEVDDTMLNFGRLKVLKARMNQDIRMGDKLKNTGAGNLFVVFGEPDIEVRGAGDNMIQVEIKGVDIFDPTTGEVKSSDNPADDIACWFIDDDYDEESFFVRHAYFLGGASGDPYKALKRALKAEIDEEAWASLHTTLSHPFPRPESGQICVKVINHFGDEVQKVFTV
ncbi:site-specific DNA-methyltransferase [Nisaea sp.]|uniref:site-specific DNA-methyltransferase n=1 Tax=Nisaea sp. TaxID=2024842 RepID=UPI0032EF497A